MEYGGRGARELVSGVGQERLLTKPLRIPAYIDLIRAIGIPGIIEGYQGKMNTHLMELAELNKISLLYSNALNDVGVNRQLIKRYELLLKTIREVTSAFSRYSINYCIFKTIKPFPTTPSDIDILLPRNDFERARDLLISLGYAKIGNDRFTITLRREMNVDLQLQPSVSNLPYLSKKLMLENTIFKDMNGIDVRVLNPAAEILVLASHSFYKEQMLTLNDYYAITILAERVDPAHLISLAKDAATLEALQVIVQLCSYITELAFNRKLKISDLKHHLGPIKEYPIDEMPLKFPFSMVIKLLAIKASKDREMRRMIIPAMIRLASPRQLGRLVAHITRSTY
jgi:hypothetical protein